MKKKQAPAVTPQNLHPHPSRSMRELDEVVDSQATAQESHRRQRHPTSASQCPQVDVCKHCSSSLHEERAIVASVSEISKCKGDSRS
jgi:hypothetical protein